MARKVQQCTGSIVRDVALYLGSGNGNGTVVVDQGAAVLLPPGAKRRRGTESRAKGPTQAQAIGHGACETKMLEIVG